MLKVIPMKTKKAIAGFTLIELIIVLAIIAVLAAVAVPGIGGYIRDNRIEEANNNAQILARGAQTWLNEMEADNKPIDATTGADLFKSTFPAASTSTMIISSRNSYNFDLIAEPGGWVKRDGNGTTMSHPMQFNLTKYLTGLKPAKSGTDLGSGYVCVDLSTKTVRYAAWTSEVDWTTATYFTGGNDHLITSANQESKVIGNTDHVIVGVYPMSDEL